MSERIMRRCSQSNDDCLSGICIAIVKAMLKI